jgi:XTP/dITP diphosphohydrolase
MKIVFASNNAGKIRELKSLLQDFTLTPVPQSELGVSEIAETGLTFVENALIKARYACQMTGLPALADDSGLAVAALHGAPGIYSARYAGANATASENNKKLLHELKNIPANARQASFHCVLVYLNHAQDPTPLICHGVWHGSILMAELGNDGFGYDPVFFVASENKSAAELPLATKNLISHRGQALRLLMEQLPQKLSDTVITGK